MENKKLENWGKLTQYDELFHHLANVENGVDLCHKNYVKWKENSNQLMLYNKEANLYYKIYEGNGFDKNSIFSSLIRNKLIEIYRDCGVDWRIQTIIVNGNIIDIERREALITEEEDFGVILKSYAKILERLQKELRLDDILRQIKKQSKSFDDVGKILLFRNCINKAEDYGRKGNQWFLLDDADFCLVLMDKQGKWIRDKKGAECFRVNVEQLGRCEFRMCIEDYLYDADKLDEKVSYWSLYKIDDDDKDHLDGRVLQSKKEEQFKYNIKTLANELEEMERELYLNNYKRKSFQWELWSYCLNKCVFCYLGNDNRDTREERQLTSLNDFIRAIDNLDFNVYNNISLIGGEFFQGECHSEKVRDKLFEVLKKIGDLYNGRKIGSCWLTTTLTKKEQVGLYEILDYYRDNKLFEPNANYGSSGLWLCTSWDTKGRFHTKEYRDNWEYHMLKIQKDYPFVKFNTTCILTEPFLLDYIEGRFSFKEFQEKYKTTIFLKQSGLGTNFSPESVIGNKRVSNEEYGRLYEDGKKRANEFYQFNFFPRREVMMEFLKKVYLEDYDVYDRLFNIKYRADELHRNFNSEEHDRKDERYKDSVNETSEASSEYVNTCGHIFNYACYGDGEKCCICDKQSMEELL